MTLNSGALNSHALNAQSEFTSTGTYTINIEQKVYSTGTAIVYFDQKVGVKNTAAINIVQIVEVHYEATYSINIAQAVLSKNNQAIEIEQRVLDPNAVNYHSRNGYEPTIYINNAPVSTDEIHGDIEIIFRENEAPQLTFTLIPPRGTQDIASYRGKSVKVYVRENSSYTRVFTGTINTPNVMLIDQKIQFDCSLDINKVVEDNVTQEFINSVGFYNEDVFSKPKKKIDELMDRITTVPKTIDWDRNGSININNIAPGTPKYTLTSADVYRENPRYIFSSQQRYINKIKINAKYTHQRLHHYQITFNATMGVSSFCNWALFKYTPMRRDLIANAANGAGWPITDLTFADFFEGGYYNCSGGTIGFITQSCQTTNNPVVDENGTQVQINGENQFENTAQFCRNTTANLCLGASWKGSTHFAQNIDRDYTLEVAAPQSISAYGEKLREETFNLSDSYNSSDWENYTKYDNTAPDGLSITGSNGPNFYIDVTPDVNKFSNSIDILLNRAKSEILKSHRDDKVVFKRSLWTAISLNDTVELNTNRVDAIGKVHEYKHVMDTSTGEAYTEVTLVLSRSTGSTSNTELALPAIDMTPTTPSYPITAISYDANYGVDVGEVNNPSGYYGNWLQNSGSGLRLTTVPVTFVVSIPAIPDSLRKVRRATNTTTFNVAIPNNTLTIYFPDDNYI